MEREEQAGQTPTPVPPQRGEAGPLPTLSRARAL